MPSLNTTNAESLIYQNDLLQLTVLGGIKLEGLDRMRATLKVELTDSSRPPVRHNLDLYNDTQLEKFIRKVAERLEIGTSVIAASLSELTEQLEQYRLEEQEKQQPEQYQPKQLSTTERKAAEAFLSIPKLMERTNAMIGKSGMIGEETNRLLMYLIFTSRKRQQPLHIVSLGSSGTGKTHLQEKIGELIPAEDKVEITTLSENAFYYFGQRELKHKLILIEDLDGAENVLYPLRELQSKKRISKTIAHKNSKGETKTMHLVVEGPLSVSGCTTKEYIYEDNANRSFLIYLDESKSQDERIMDYQRAVSAGQIDTAAEEEAATLLRNCQRILSPIKVVNPYAPLLKIPEEVFKPRRTNSHYLQFIEAVTFYHQYQREAKADKETGELCIETTLEDIAQANTLIKEILLRKSDELSGACRNYLENVKAYLAQAGQTTFTNREIRKALKVNESNQKRWTIALHSNYYLKRVKGSKSKGFQYEVVSYKEFQQLKKQVGNVLDETLSSLSNRERSGVVQSNNEPLNQQETSVKEEWFTVTAEKDMRAEKNALTPPLQEHLNWLMDYLNSQDKKSFTNSEIQALTGKSGTGIRKHHRDLLASGKIAIASGSKHTGYTYQLVIV